MIFQIAICDDDPIYINDIRKKVEKYFEERKLESNIYEFTSGDYLLKSVKEKEFNIIFLDIEMPGITGMEVAHEIRNLNVQTMIIFVTTHETFALESFNLGAVGYIVKPAAMEKLNIALDRSVIYVKNHYDELEFSKRYLKLIHGKEVINLEMSKIIRIDKYRNSVTIKLIDGSTYTHYESIKKIMPSLNENFFTQISQGCIINMRYVDHIEPFESQILILKDSKEEIKISRNCYQNARLAFHRSLRYI